MKLHRRMTLHRADVVAAVPADFPERVTAEIQRVADLSKDQRQARTFDSFTESLMFSPLRQIVLAPEGEFRAYNMVEACVINVHPDRNSNGVWVGSYTITVRDVPDCTYGQPGQPGQSYASYVLTADVMFVSGTRPDDEFTVTPDSDDVHAFFEQIWTTVRRQHKTRKLALIHERIPNVTITGSGGAVPFQAEGTIDGYEFYFRYRHGSASLRVGTDDAVSVPYWAAGVVYGDDLDGTLNYDEFVFLFCHLAARLDVAEFTYRFTLSPDAIRTKLAAHPDDMAQLLEQPRWINAYGFTVDEARERVADQLTSRSNIAVLSPYVKGVAATFQHYGTSLADVGFTLDDFKPNVDERDFTLRNPALTVRRELGEPVNPRAPQYPERN